MIAETPTLLNRVSNPGQLWEKEAGARVRALSRLDRHDKVGDLPQSRLYTRTNLDLNFSFVC